MSATPAAHYVAAGTNSLAQLNPIHTIGNSAQPVQYMVAPTEAYAGDKVLLFGMRTIFSTFYRQLLFYRHG
jgi:hypothetical protein